MFGDRLAQQRVAAAGTMPLDIAREDGTGYAGPEGMMGIKRPGGFAEAAAKMNHYAWASGETVVQVHGQGPFAITYVNPADDPSKK